MKISLFIPCFIDQLFPRIGVSVVRVLRQLGHSVEVPQPQTCCGQPAFNSGFWDEARTVARPVLRAFRDAEAIVIPSGSCGAMLKAFYPELFAGQPEHDDARAIAARTYEFSQFLVDRLKVTDIDARCDAVATFHDGCHGLRELRVRQQPRQLLACVKDLKLVEMDDAQTCCGFGGTFAAKFASISTAMGNAKLSNIERTGAHLIVSNDASCLMHLQGLLDRQGRKLRTAHLAEVLAGVVAAKSDWSVEGAP